MKRKTLYRNRLDGCEHTAVHRQKQCEPRTNLETCCRSMPFCWHLFGVSPLLPYGCMQPGLPTVSVFRSPIAIDHKMLNCLAARPQTRCMNVYKWMFIVILVGFWHLSKHLLQSLLVDAILLIIHRHRYDFQSFCQQQPGATRELAPPFLYAWVCKIGFSKFLSEGLVVIKCSPNVHQKWGHIKCETAMHARNKDVLHRSSWYGSMAYQSYWLGVGTTI